MYRVPAAALERGARLEHGSRAPVGASTEDPAFGTDEKGRIVLWNAAVERLLGHRATEVLGRRCADVVCGRDLFGNLYCTPNCNPRQLARCGAGSRRFQMEVRRARGDYLRAAVATVRLQGPSPQEYTLLHILQPEDHPQAEAPGPGRGLPANTLTRREIEVLRLLASGQDSAAIAGSLCISVATVRKHVQNILTKLEAHSRVEAVCLALRNHLV